ncbi:glycosyl transferase family 2 [Thermotomaculum hydrothermale]|uniref:Glycosyl transferase family 2 n=1 Tax=Thermotomaculum hydrothermale TaxID=981385 RepID=A0A7R6PNC9_9BACT|nr:glycosyltransferase family 2 protein [Thermotomaculum hydrothermale]BBB32256.1 glycosyl transferase family 2 [Thermotomaculum hydrothermale]
MVDISVIIVNYNGEKYLPDCLNSLLNQTFKNFEIIVVDNNSQDSSRNYLKQIKNSQIKTIFLEKNSGFGAGNNIGFKHSKGKYIVILNNDAEVKDDFLENIIKPFDIDEEIGMVAPLILFKFNPDTIDKAGGHLVYFDGLNRGRGCQEKLSEKYLKPGYVLIPDGCAACFKREVIEKYDFFDEDFFLYGEDTDLGLRYVRAGVKCYYQPDAVVYHMHSATAGEYSRLKAYYVERNRVFVLIKNFPIVCVLLSPFFTLIRYFFQALSVFVKKGSAGEFTKEYSAFELLKILLKANIDSLKLLPVFWGKRRDLKSKVKINGIGFCKKILNFFLSPVELAFKK